MMSWVVMRNVDNDDEAEAFGPFSTQQAADNFRDAYDEWGPTGGYGYVVTELRPVRGGLAEVRAAKAEER
jgi:hypothetical protein